MQVSVEDVSSVKKVLHIEIPQEEVSRELDEAYKNLKSTAKVKGFRPGKTPRSVLERLYGKSVKAEVSAKLIQDSFESAIKDRELAFVGNPNIEPTELDEGASYKYDATVEVSPEIGEIEFRGITLAKTNYKVTEEAIAKQIEALQKNMAQQKTLEEQRPAQKGDPVLIDFDAFKDGTPFAEIGKSENHTVKIGSGQMLKEIEDALAGMNPGDTKEVPVLFPEEHPDKKIAGLEIVFHVTLREIREEILPEANDELARKFNCETLDDLKKQITDNLKEGYEKRTEQELNEQAFLAMLDKHEFEVPDAWVEPELEMIITDAERAFLYSDKSMEELGITREMLAAKYRDTAVNQVKRHVLLSRLVEQEKLTLSDEELDAGMKEMAGKLNRPHEEIKKHYKQSKADLDYFKHTLLEKRAMRLIIENSTLEETDAE